MIAQKQSEVPTKEMYDDLYYILFRAFGVREFTYQDMYDQPFYSRAEDYFGKGWMSIMIGNLADDRLIKRRITSLLTFYSCTTSPDWELSANGFEAML